jgi:predicted DNA-binding transcriptional regulator AlpA
MRRIPLETIPAIEASPLPRPDALAHVTTLTKEQVCEALQCKPWTLDRWVRLKKFPAPFSTVDDGPSRWTLAMVADHIERRRRKRQRYRLRGRLRRGQTLPPPNENESPARRTGHD